MSRVVSEGRFPSPGDACWGRSGSVLQGLWEQACLGLPCTAAELPAPACFLPVSSVGGLTPDHRESVPGQGHITNRARLGLGTS